MYRGKCQELTRKLVLVAHFNYLYKQKQAYHRYTYIYIYIICIYIINKSTFQDTLVEL